MKLKVMYQSRSGNTKKVADVIAGVVKETAEAMPPAYPLENVGLLFIGGGIYAGKLDPKMEEFVRTLNPNRVKNAAVFGTSGSDEKGLEKLKELLKAQGINVLEETFHCRGKWFLFFSRKHPDASDLNRAAEFAKKMLAKVGNQE